AEGPRRLLLALLDVEVDVLLRGEVDSQRRQRRLERGQHLLAGEVLVPLGRAKEPRRIPAFRLGEGDTRAGAEEAVGGLDEHGLRRRQEGAALGGEVLE